MGLCKSEDDFITEKLRWVITLSNGETIYQDDDRPGEEQAKAWIRLRDYVKLNKVDIVDFKIQFCSHIEQAANPNAEGYYFARKVGAFAFSGEAENTMYYYVVGELRDGKIYTTQWSVPEILRVGSDVRDVVEDDIHLIINPSKVHV